MGIWDSLGEGWSHEVNESLVKGIEIITIFWRSQGKFLDNAVGEKGGMEMWEFGRNFSDIEEQQVLIWEEEFWVSQGTSKRARRVK